MDVDVNVQTCRYDVMNILCGILVYKDVVLRNHVTIVWKEVLIV